MDINAFILERAMAAEFQRINLSKVELRPHRNSTEEIIRWQRRTSYIPTKTMLHSAIDAHCCKIPFEELKPIKLSEMEIPKIHYGKYLVCKVVGKPIANLGVHVLVEDLNGDVEEASFYNFRYNLDDIDWISVGTIFVIKEPQLQHSQSKTPFLRIDSPSDIIIFDSADEAFLEKIGAKQWYEPLSKDPEIWRQKANECFKNGKYEKALFLYDRGIRCNPDLAVLYLNKSLTCLKIGAFYDAYKSAKLGLEKGGDREKALYRMGQAAYGMREWQKAANHFVEVLKEFPQNSDAPKELKRATDRLKEQKTGKLDFKRMFIESKKGKNSKLDVADYIGPIEITDILGKGRGIIASKDIQKGTLLIVCKSVGSGYSQDFPHLIFEGHNFGQDDPNSTAQMLQVIAAIQHLKNNPQIAKEIYDLYADDDTIEKEEIPEGVLDVARIEKICIHNHYDGDARNMTNSCHMFILPSYFNHSCLANALHETFNDYMVVHAATDIKKGEEIYVSYVDPLSDYLNRKEQCSTRNFICTCKLCEIDSKDEFCAKRNQMLEEFKVFTERNKNSLEKVIEKGEEVLKKIRETYVKRKDYKIVLAQMLNLLCQHYIHINPFKCIQILEECATLADDYLNFALCMPRIYYLLAEIYSGLETSTKSDEMMQKALETSFCTDFEHLKIVYG